MAVFGPTILLTLYVVTKFSDDYETAAQFVAQDPRIASAIGKVQQVDFRFWSGFESIRGTCGHAHYSFDASSHRGDFVVDVHLRFVAGVWRIEGADIGAGDGAQIHIGSLLVGLECGCFK